MYLIDTQHASCCRCYDDHYCVLFVGFQFPGEICSADFGYLHRDQCPYYLFPWDWEMFQPYLSLDAYTDKIYVPHYQHAVNHIEHVYSELSFNEDTYNVKKAWTLDWSIRFFKCYYVNWYCYQHLLHFLACQNQFTKSSNFDDCTLCLFTM